MSSGSSDLILLSAIMPNKGKGSPTLSASVEDGSSMFLDSSETETGRLRSVRKHPDV